MATVSDLDVLIVGAGPTGLALATQLRRFAIRFRIVDRSLDRARESRALAVQARTLELLDSIGLGDALVSRGRTSTRVVFHFGARPVAAVQLGEIGATDTQGRRASVPEFPSIDAGKCRDKRRQKRHQLFCYA